MPSPGCLQICRSSVSISFSTQRIFRKTHVSMENGRNDLMLEEGVVSSFSAERPSVYRSAVVWLWYLHTVLDHIIFLVRFSVCKSLLQSAAKRSGCRFSPS
jgi:hypothetical protein